jgi:16S rRNA (cytidine1402-2'-O)-methyltransferase
VVGTPIGNLDDLTPRARAVLAAAALVAAEDTRVSRRLLDLAGSSARMLSLTEHNATGRTATLLDAAETGVVAIVSDAGTPGISDPGARVVEAAHEAGIPVFAIAGPSALAAALSVAGFDGGPAVFLGFLPKPRGERLAVLRALPQGAVAVCFEAPGRAAATLAELSEVFDDPEAVVCRELTKLYEEAVRGRASALAARFRETRGEVTLVFRVPDRAIDAGEEAVRAYLAEMHRAGARRAGAAAEAARRFAISRERAYALWPGPDEGSPS